MLPLNNEASLSRACNIHFNGISIWRSGFEYFITYCSIVINSVNSEKRSVFLSANNGANDDLYMIYHGIV